MPEIGRISGPLLKSNLVRHTPGQGGVPLAFETDLLYLNNSDVDPANHVIGIKNTNPNYTLDVTGTVRATERVLVKQVGGTNAFAEIDEVNIDGNKIQTTVGNLVLQAATGSDLVQLKSIVQITSNDLTTNQTTFNIINGTATTVQAFGAAELLVFASSTGTTTFRSDVVINKDLQIKGGDLTTNADTFNLFNADASTINAFGVASTINIGRPSSGRTNIKHDLKVDGSLEVVGDITLGGSINIGDANTDNVVFGADVNSSIIPNIASTYDLGSLAKPWREGYFDDVFVDGLSVGNITVIGSFLNDQVEIVGNTIRTFRSNADLELDTAGTGQVVVLGQAGFIVPVGTTPERPALARTGTIRLNTDTQRLENYNGVAWNRMLHDDDAIAFAIALG